MSRLGSVEGDSSFFPPLCGWQVRNIMSQRTWRLLWGPVDIIYVPVEVVCHNWYRRIVQWTQSQQSRDGDHYEKWS
jgi:hypothetical protein